MEEYKLTSKCYICELEISHKLVIFGFDPKLTQTCQAKIDTTVHAPKGYRSPNQSHSSTMAKNAVVSTKAEQTTDSANPISASEKSVEESQI